MKTCLSVMVVILLTGCGSDSKDDNETAIKDLILQQEAAWQATGIDTYTFTYSAVPNDCPAADPFPPVEIQVVEGEITSLFVSSFDDYLSLSEAAFPTIDQLFVKMKQQASYIQGVPDFDKTLHFPKRYSVNLSDASCDGQTITIHSFI